MAWWQIRKQQRGKSGTTPDVTMPEGARTAHHDGRFVRPAESTVAPAKVEAHRLVELNRHRDELRFEVEQGELAQSESNPWSERITLLNDTLATIKADREAVIATPDAPSWQVPDVPIDNLIGTAEEPSSIRFAIASEPFLYAEEIDWDQRGGAVVRGDLRHQEGDVFAILPVETPQALRQALSDHLVSSLMTFATDMRNRSLDDEALPAHISLRDLAAPCHECGGWQEWGGRCPACTERDMRLQTLHMELLRIHDDRTAEAETRHQLIEHLPLARRRLASVEAELAVVRSRS